MYLCVESCEENCIRSVLKKLKNEIRIYIVIDFMISVVMFKSQVNVKSTFNYVEGVIVCERHQR
jgi:hypothetical protein